MKLKSLLATLILVAAHAALAAIPADWTTPIAPFKISGNLYYVGSRDLAAYLVTTPRGNILINANLESSPPLIKHSVEQLGFKWADTKILLSSQAHYDHAAGAAEVVKETHATHMVMDGDVDVMQSGGATDYDTSLDRFPAAHVDRVLHDGEKVELGGTTIVAHKTAGHTKGTTTWTMQTQDGAKTRNVVIVGGWAWNPAVRLVTANGKTESYPGIERDFNHTFAVMKTYPCDIFLGAHGVYFNMLPKLERMQKEGAAVFIDPKGYQAALAEKEANFRKEVAAEKAGK
ncbi:Zn-dependent hydrolase, glyoxylase [Terriglobus roseus DSM 18391]|uniref:Zn-dependent hydrolase, glyoxylase n=1 Tax=Terriglobus roseus (strain DSM 18391 / NRRL B-41598 / KBS 63) TaxID=926566 RepID=I3ZAT7_TERRK|nr:subclass B3 metallo-beta-lactamase [Terriglobus roseus]AFL86355.1 Zn-dependent hydrolase, glyoxylase [Terriglobus roseus DSM 18391]